ncbi:MAG: hypothetical protein ISS18_14920, partial [Bacteroidales bacterium]|nr:hypothetical protein [Bacteroidales bacterium]
MHKYPAIHDVIYKLRQQKCSDPDCKYCRNYLDTKKSLLCFFGYDNFREFDNVFLLLKDYFLISDEKKRAVYVAITRAKTNLFIYTNQNYFDKIDVINLNRKSDNKEYSNPAEISLYLTHRDIDLGFFKLEGIQNTVSNLFAGEELRLSEKNDGLKTQNKKYALKFSKKF